MAYLFEHTKFGFCWLDLLALLILLAVIVVFGVRNRDLKKQQKDLEDQLDDLYSGDAKKRQFGDTGISGNEKIVK